MAEAAKRRSTTGTAETAVPHGDTERQICTVTFCPICAAVTAGQTVRPEAVEHLLAAGRELLLAVSSILGARAQGREAGGEPSATLTRIDIE